MSEHSLDRLGDLFPKLYYFFPVSTRRIIKLEKEAITITEPMDAVLWMVKLLADESTNGQCFQQDVQALVRWWYPQASFSRSLRYLVRAGCIEQSVVTADARKNWLNLTPLGENLLANLKSERLDFIRIFFDGFSIKEQEQLVRLFEQLSRVTWAQMKKQSLNIS